MFTLATHPHNSIINFGVSHYITFDLHNLSIHTNYRENKGIIIDNDNEIPITHIGSIIFHLYTNTFTLDQVQNKDNIYERSSIHKSPSKLLLL